jgi:uncharacterized protein
MDLSVVLSNFLTPPVLFFFLGMVAVFVQSDLEIPPPIPKLLSLYLLLAIGFKGGVELANSGISQTVVLTLTAAIAMSALIPVYSFFILRTKFDDYNAAAIAATYGAISAVTFITASSFLAQLNIDYDGFMVAALALMESPAIVIGLILVSLFARKQGGDRTDLLSESSSELSNKSEDRIELYDNTSNWTEVLREAFLNGSVFLLGGSVLIGMITGEHGWQTLKPFTQDMFYGVLTFFLLDMGLVAAKRIKDLKKTGGFLIGFAILMPIVNAAIGIGIAKAIALPAGDALLFAVLCASASYIAVPAAMRMSVPEANPSFYISAALALTFPFNILLGIPLYQYAISLLW